MKSVLRLGVVAAGLAIVVLAENLFAREINAVFLRYPGIDKVLHTVEYALVFTIVHFAAGRAGLRPTHRVWAAVLAAGTIAALDEGFQQLAPARTVEGFDLIANIAGIALGWGLARRRADVLGAVAVTAALSVTGVVAWDTHTKLIDYSRAIRSEQQGDFVSARHHLHRALDAGMQGASLYNEVAWVEIESGVGDLEAAVKYAGMAVALRPDNADMLDTYGWALHHTGRNEEALQYLLEAYERHPAMYCIHYHLGVVYLALSRPEKAREHLERQVRMTGTREAAMAERVLAALPSRHPTTP